MMKKYEFTGETMEFEGRTLRRIRYIRQVSHHIFKNILGGWIEGEHNLSHFRDCYVVHEAKVFGHAQIMDDAVASGNAIVRDNVKMKGDSHISDDAIVGADTILDDDAWVQENSKVFFYADENYGQPNVYGDSNILGETMIEGTGYIRESDVNNLSLFGHLAVDKQILGTPSDLSVTTRKERSY